MPPRATALGVAAAAALAAGAVAAPETPGAFELLDRVRQAYADLESYGDLGEIEITSGAPGSERTTLLFFETAAAAEGGFLWRMHGESAAGFEERVIWEGDAGVFVYRSLYGQYKPLPSVVGELAHALDRGGYEALVVALLLAGADDVLSDPPAASVEGAEPCGDATCWVISLTRMAGAVDCQLQVHQRTYMIHEVVVTLEGQGPPPPPGSAAPGGPRGDGGPSTLRVRHHPSIEGRPAYQPPAGARRVAEWQPPTADGDGDDAVAGDAPWPEAAFAEEITVSLVTVAARIVDSRGEPILGLAPDDLIVRVGDAEVPVLDLEWTSSERQVESPSGRAPARAAGGRPPAGRLIVFFLQVDLEPTRVAGHLKVLPDVERLLDGLHPDDFVAIASFDSHLKLWQDFSKDRARTFEVLTRAIGYGVPAARRRPGLSLMEHFDLRAAADATTPEVALRLTAEALTPLPGEKDLVFLGWGLGRYGAGGVRMTADYEPTVRALAAARATVFVLDVSQADYHSLEVGLQGVAARTGGTYDRTFHFASQAVDRLARTLGGHYVVTIDRTATAEASGRLTVRLRHRRGRVLFKPLILG